ncbi:hypothetical protein J9317_06300 [Metabacillus sp. KIGAM252]|uniref:Hydrolase n=1 Tax=Metabacillus flavus TaxID=2823519 RepID=A0ABS5LCB3_9BACI|nr:hypothetical protein [Metabacillus flavus]MBS2968368.1 hypothetical protein [Metabacillus flavus]
MEIYDRFFQYESEWTVIHTPYQPNGFGILILGDKNHFVDGQTSFWMQHLGRKQLLAALRKAGFTLIQSNLHGSHWGSPKAGDLAEKLLHLFPKKEIINDKVHLLAEGTGALAALELMERSPERLRSIGLFNPCLDLQSYINDEKMNKLFYKRLTREIAAAYEIDVKELEHYSFRSINQLESTVPVKIWDRMSGTPFPYQKHSKAFEEQRKEEGYPIELILHLGEQPYRIHQSVIKYFSLHQKNL